MIINQARQLKFSCLITVFSFFMLSSFSIHAHENLLPEIQVFSPETGLSRGYQTTPQELLLIAERARNEQEPYHSAVDLVLNEAQKGWNYGIDYVESCGGADSPGWIDNDEGVSRLYARALAYHLTGEETYAAEAKAILQRIMGENFQISIRNAQCRLNFSWGIPEILASADLIETYWINDSCTSYAGINYDDDSLVSGNCKEVFQNWLARNPYYIISLSAEESQNNWGASATNTLAYIADYLWDRPEMRLFNRTPTEINEGNDIELSPDEAYARANQLAIDRMNGYRVDYRSRYACDLMDEIEQVADFTVVKSQITPLGIIPDEARREETCNIERYNGEYQNYPQLHLGHNIQQCELMFRRGDRSCYDNMDILDIPDYEFIDSNGQTQTTQLYTGRGSIERAINAIIIDSDTEWRHDSALEVAYRYYSFFHRNEGFQTWRPQLDHPADCWQDICFGTLTHGFPNGEIPLPIFIISAQ